MRDDKHTHLRMGASAWIFCSSRKNESDLLTPQSFDVGGKKASDTHFHVNLGLKRKRINIPKKRRESEKSEKNV